VGLWRRIGVRVLPQPFQGCDSSGAFSQDSSVVVTLGFVAESLWILQLEACLRSVWAHDGWAMQVRRRLLLILLGVGVLVGVLVVALRPAPEPEYEGKKLSEWVVEFSTNASPAGKSRAEQAVRHIGTNALPYLLTWIRYEAPLRTTALHEAIVVARQTLNAAWNPSDKQYRAEGALVAFSALGQEAKGAIPELVRIFNDPKTKPQTAVRAVLALGNLGKDALPPLLKVLNDPDWRKRLAAAEALEKVRAQ
jgi:hypothetical protein